MVAREDVFEADFRDGKVAEECCTFLEVSCCCCKELRIHDLVFVTQAPFWSMYRAGERNAAQEMERTKGAAKENQVRSSTQQPLLCFLLFPVGKADAEEGNHCNH